LASARERQQFVANAALLPARKDIEMFEPSRRGCTMANNAPFRTRRDDATRGKHLVRQKRDVFSLRVIEWLGHEREARLTHMAMQKRILFNV
jgi:hypothetical protein